MTIEEIQMHEVDSLNATKYGQSRVVLSFRVWDGSKSCNGELRLSGEQYWKLLARLLQVQSQMISNA